jgi:hypothetical protein
MPKCLLGRFAAVLLTSGLLAASSGGHAGAQPAPTPALGADRESEREPAFEPEPDESRGSSYRPSVTATPSEPERVGLSNHDFTPADFAEPEPQPSAARSEPPSDELEPWVFITLTATTGVLGVFTLASGIDTLSKNGAYEDYARYPDSSPAAARRDYADAHSAQARTNVLIGSTAAMAIASLVVGVWFTDWGSAREAEVKLSPYFGARAAGLQFVQAL